MTAAAERLEGLIRRIRRLAHEPEAVGGKLRFLTRPFLRLFRREPKLGVERVAALVDLLRAPASQGLDSRLDEVLNQALDELDDDIDGLEHACIVDGTPPAAHLLWVWRLYGVVARATRAIESGDTGVRRVAGAIDPRILAPPLVAGAERVRDAEQGERVAPVALVDALLDAARSESDHLGRKRRLIEVARRNLLEASAAFDLDPSAVAHRQEWMAREIQAIDAFQASGVAPDVGLLHQARRAVSRGDRETAAAALRALDGVASARGDLELGRITGQALTSMGARRSDRDPTARRSQMASLARRALGADVERAIASGYASARDDLVERIGRAKGLVRENLESSRDHVEAEAALEQLLTTFGVDGAVDVGGATTPMRVLEETRTLRAVRYPTDQMVLLPARSPAEVVDAVILDPRAILVHLAAGKLLSRRWVAEEVRRRERVKLATEVRVYLLDGSTSMMGPRARMRDAVLLAELVTLRARLLDAERFYDPVLYYRYFTKKPWDTRRVATPAGCLAAVSEVVSQVKIGETDIERALLASFRQIRESQHEDPRLGRASVVLITDGEADLDLDVVWAARQAVGDLPVRINIVALGEENAALQSLAARQRARGEEVFYQFLSDDFLESVLAGYPDRQSYEWLPPAAPEELDDELGSLLDELHGLDRARDVESLAMLGTYQTTLEDMGVALDELNDGDRARIEAQHRDRRALMHRFERWFPAPVRFTVPPEDLPRGTAADRDVGQVRAALAAVAETVDVVGSRGLRRQADAVELVERILIESGMSPLGYARVLEVHGRRLADSLADVRRAAHAEA